jgi:hypothetical protein
MRHRVLGHVRGNVVAYAALFVALSGTAVAATSALPANSVGTSQLKNGAVTGQKVAGSTLTGANIKASTLGTVPNATELSGLAGTAYQRRISTACASGQAMRSVSATGAPTCQAFGQGTITAVTAGTGLTGGATSGGATLNVDPTAVQNRVTGSCALGSAVASVAQDGTVACQSTALPMFGGTGGGVVSGTGGYLAPEGLTTSPGGTFGAVALGAPAVDSRIRNLSVELGTAPGDGYEWGVALEVNGNLSSVGCGISGTDTSCTDTTDFTTLHAGDQIAFVIFSLAGTPAPTTVSFGWTDNT